MLALLSSFLLPVVVATTTAATATPPSATGPVDVAPDLGRVQDPVPYPTFGWVIPQLIPSPELLVGTSGPSAGLRWQVTPFLYSFGLNRRVTPWRFLVADPLSRQSGSIELFFSPEFVAAGHRTSEAFIARTGARSYFPLVQKGDYLSVSIGGSHFLYVDRYGRARSGAAIEAGGYIASGIFGLQITYCPTRDVADTAEWIATLRFRYF